MHIVVPYLGQQGLRVQSELNIICVGRKNLPPLIMMAHFHNRLAFPFVFTNKGSWSSFFTGNSERRKVALLSVIVLIKTLQGDNKPEGKLSLSCQWEEQSQKNQELETREMSVGP